MSIFQIKAPSSRQGTVQVLTSTTTSAALPSNFGAETFQICVTTSAAVNMTIGNAPTTSATSGTYLPADSATYWTVSPGQNAAFIGAATVSVTELS